MILKSSTWDIQFETWTKISVSSLISAGQYHTLTTTFLEITLLKCMVYTFVISLPSTMCHSVWKTLIFSDQFWQ